MESIKEGRGLHGSDEQDHFLGIDRFDDDPGDLFKLLLLYAPVNVPGRCSFIQSYRTLF